MRRSLLLLLLALLVPLAAACEEKPRDPSQWPIRETELASTPPAELGESAYRKTCIACHGGDGRGNGGTTGADLTREGGLRAMTDDALRAVVRDGRRGAIGVMPAHRGLLSPAEIDAVVAYVRTRFAPATDVTLDSLVP